LQQEISIQLDLYSAKLNSVLFFDQRERRRSFGLPSFFFRSCLSIPGEMLGNSLEVNLPAGKDKAAFLLVRLRRAKKKKSCRIGFQCVTKGSVRSF
jgi:hypothetical protein